MTSRKDFLERILPTLVHRETALIYLKNRGYASEADVFSNLREGGYLGVVFRLQDKISRLRNLLQGNTVELPDETIYDTILDARNYLALLYGMLGEDQWHDGSTRPSE